jgi:ferredoxin-NADP reductase
MVSMLHALAAERPVVGAPPRAVVFLHACDNGEVHALRAEVEAAAALRPEIVAHYCYRFPTERDQAERAHHSEGVVTGEVLERLLPAGVERDHYMCGPPPFMSAVYKLLRSRGVAKERIAYEFFGPATVLEADVAAAGDEAGG